MHVNNGSNNHQELKDFVYITYSTIQTLKNTKAIYIALLYEILPCSRCLYGDMPNSILRDFSADGRFFVFEVTLLQVAKIKVAVSNFLGRVGWGYDRPTRLASSQLLISSRSKRSLKQAKRAFMAGDRASDKIARSEQNTCKSTKTNIRTLQRKSKKDTKLWSSESFFQLAFIFVSSETVSNPQMHGP